VSALRGDGLGRAAGELARRPAARRAAAALGALTLVVQVAGWWPRHARRDDHWLDARYYFEAARHVRRAESLYRECAGYRIDEPPTCYLYPPTLAAALSPLGGAGRTLFQAVWYGVILAAFWAYVVGLLRLARIPLTASNVLAAGLVGQLVPGMIVTMSFGNADVLVWALCAFAVGAERSAGLMGLAAALKVFPVWPVALAWGARGRRGFALRGGAALVLAAAVTALVAGPSSFVEWIRSGSAPLSQGTTVHGNFSAPMGVLRLLALAGALDLGAGTMPTAARVFLVVCPLVGVPAIWHRLREAPPGLRDGLTLVAAVLLSPICWWFYAPLLLVPLAAWRGARSATLAVHRGSGGALG
jgi:hypothetical protein